MIFDAHVHAAREFANTDSLIEQLDKLGIDKIVLCPSLRNNKALPDAPKIPVPAKNSEKLYFLNRICRISYRYMIKDQGDGNAFVYSLAKNNSKRIVQFYWVNPLDPDAIEQLQLAIKEWSIKGIKLHQACHAFEINSSTVQRIAKIAESEQLPIFIHLYLKEDVYQLIELAAKYPNTIFIVAHLIGMEIIAKHKNRLQNIYFEISGEKTIITKERIVYAINEFGSERIMYGSDAPFISMELSLDRINNIPILDTQKANILGNNLAALL